MLDMTANKLAVVSETSSLSSGSALPLHIAIIMDGNRRWAKLRGLPTSQGHHRGAKVAKQFVDNCFSYGIKQVTLFAFSSDNWNRDVKEVNTLISLLDEYLIKDLQKIKEQGVRIRIIGNLERFNPKIIEKLLKLQEDSEDNKKHILTLALSYSGRDDILHSCRNIAQKFASGQIALDQINESMLSDNLMTCGLTDPDLLIRTSGESRISNFMLWQLSYTELHFSDKLWPDFNKLVSGYREFYKQYFSDSNTIYNELKDGQAPKTLVIACSDSRVDPAILMNADPGDLFVIRNVANIVPPYQPDAAMHGVSAALEFAVKVLQVENIVILGHSSCAGVNALIHPEKLEDSDFIHNWINIASPARNRMMLTVEGGEITKEHEHSCEREVIVLSLNNLLSFPWIISRIKQNGLKLHGWYFNIGDGKISQYNPNTNAFEEV